MSNSSFPTPQTLAEAEAAERVIAGFYLSQIEAAEAVMTGPEAQAFETAVAAAISAGLPNGTSAAVNLTNVAKWFVDVRTGLEADRQRLDAIANPPAPEKPEAPDEQEP